MLRYEDRQRIIAVMKDGTQIGTINPNQSGSVGYSIFSSPIMGTASSVEEAKKKLEDALS